MMQRSSSMSIVTRLAAFCAVAVPATIGAAAGAQGYFGGGIGVGGYGNARMIGGPRFMMNLNRPGGQYNQFNNDGALNSYFGLGAQDALPPPSNLLDLATGERVNLQPDSVVTQVLARTSDRVDAKIDKDGNVLVKWSGESSAVNQITVALLDKDKKVIKEKKITRLPAEARFALTNKTAFYRATVEYLNGTTSTVVSPL